MAILVALFSMRFLRARRESGEGAAGTTGDIGFAATSTGLPGLDKLPVRSKAAARDEASYHVEESGTHEQPAVPAARGDSVASVPDVAATTLSGTDVPVTLDQGDPLAEADFHMAYGLYDQAADLVKIGLSREPQRRDLKLKLLEVFFVWGNKDQFLQTAREIASTRDQALPGEWEKVVIMGRQIAPDDPLFTQGGALAGATSGGVDLNLEGGQNRVDFDLHGEPHMAPPPSSSVQHHDLDLDLHSALGDTDPTGESAETGRGTGSDTGRRPSQS